MNTAPIIANNTSDRVKKPAVSVLDWLRVVSHPLDQIMKLYAHQLQQKLSPLVRFIEKIDTKLILKIFSAFTIAFVAMIAKSK